MEELTTKNNEIYNIRGEEVILDSTLALAFNLETKRINEIVRRNKEKFSKDSYFQLTLEEVCSLRSQSATLKMSRGQHSKYLPYVFTKVGVEVLGEVIKIQNKEIIVKNILQNFSSNISLIRPVNTEKIEDLIYEIRGKRVMLDSDLARLYECKNGTKTINLAVKRHPKRFPNNFMFQLTFNEYSNLKFQIETSSLNNYGGVRKLPFAFTEQGVAMLSAVLRTPVADKVSVMIMNAFTEMKRYISQELLEQKYYKNMLLKHDEEIKLLQKTFAKFQNNEEINTIFFEGEIYDAYSKLVDIMNKAQEELIIIDNYADKTVLDMIKNIKINVLLITRGSLLTNIDISKYQEQYHNLEIIYNDSFHDRYLILDSKIIYHCGASLNKAGRRTFSINKLEDIKVKDMLIQETNKIKKYN